MSDFVYIVRHSKIIQVVFVICIQKIDNKFMHIFFLKLVAVF